METAGSLETWIKDRLSNRDRECPGELLQDILNRRESIIRTLCATFERTTCELVEIGDISRPDELLEAFAMAWLIQAREAFPLIIDVCNAAGERLDELFEPISITEELPFVMEALLDKDWHQLQSHIENEEVHSETRSAYLQTLVLGLASGKCSQDQIHVFLERLFDGILEGTFTDPYFCDSLLNAVSELGGQAWQEQIREIYGREICSPHSIRLEEMLEAKETEPEENLNWLRELVHRHRFGQIASSLDEETLREITRQCHQGAKVQERMPSWGDRNAPCGCGSGKKYKKCCLLAQITWEPICIKNINITTEPLDLVKSYGIAPSDEGRLIAMAARMCGKSNDMDASQLLADVDFWISEYPQVPFFWHRKYLHLRVANRSKEAFEALREIVARFPEDLFGVSEYACYLLRRGEPERAWAALKQAESIEMFVPGRKDFYLDEVRSFYTALAHYYAAVGRLSCAEGCRRLIEKIDPGCEEINELQAAIRAARTLDQQKKRALAAAES